MRKSQIIDQEKTKVKELFETNQRIRAKVAQVKAGLKDVELKQKRDKVRQQRTQQKARELSPELANCKLEFDGM